MHVNSHPDRSAEGREMAAREDSNTRDMGAVRPKTGKKDSFEDGNPTFYPRSFFSCCFFISLAAYAGFQDLQAVLFSSY